MNQNIQPNTLNIEISDLIEEINHVRQELTATIPNIRREVDSIINGHVTSVQQIEKLLDRLLDYAIFGCDDGEFRRLNNYYATVNKENSREYDSIYNKLFEK